MGTGSLLFSTGNQAMNQLHEYSRRLVAWHYGDRGLVLQRLMSFQNEKLPVTGPLPK